MFPVKMRLGVVFVLIMSTGAFALSNDHAPNSTNQAVRRVADRLVAEQETSAPLEGAWGAKGGLSAGSFTGTMAAGLADAYWMTCEPAYRDAAEAAGYWIWDNAPGCALYYDEAYAFMQLSQIACDPADNDWRTALGEFYGCIESQPLDEDYGLAGTALFIAQIEGHLAPPYATLEVAYYTVAAYFIDSPDKAFWRSELIRLLEAANAVSDIQVQTLGVATWALAKTGDLDATSCFVGVPAWSGYPGGVATSLEQLPALLESYQVPGTYPIYDNHFYSVYLPPNEGFSGWIETNIFSLMGLDAAVESDASYDFRSAIDAAWAVNMQPVDQYGYVWYNAIDIPGYGDNVATYLYAGEFLQCQAATRLPGDIDLNDVVDIEDVKIMALNWLGPDAPCPYNCSVADLNRDRKVNLLDFARLGQGWLLSRPTY
jgi:hypothetical protein